MTGAEIILLLACSALLALFCWREYCHDRERRDLYSRLMARDLADYSSANRQKPPKERNFIIAGLRNGLRQGQKAGEEAGD